MVEFLNNTAWPMEKPASYGTFHLIATVILFSILIFVAIKLKNTNDKQNRIVLGVVGGFLLLTEVYKIAFHMTVNPYNWGFFGAFPFQLCSVPMYLSIFCAFCKNDKINAWLYENMFAINMFGGLMAFIEPSGINHPYITLTLHAYIWHAMLVFIGVYLYLSRRACVTKYGYIKAVVVYLASCVLAQSFNLIFKEKVNCFYISPYVRSPLAVFKDFYTNYGWLTNMVLLILALIIASALIYYTGYYFRTRKTKNA